MSTGARQHYLPAAYIGGFSAKDRGPLRERPVWVARRGVPEPYVQKPGNLASGGRLYTLADPGNRDPDMVDRAWSGVEARLPAAVDAFVRAEGKPVPADAWATVAAFITHVFVRHPEFALRFEERMARVLGSGELNSADNTNVARLFEAQRLAPAIMYAGWRLLHDRSSWPLATTDVAHVPTFDAQVDGTGYVIPLRRDLAVLLWPSPEGHQMSWIDGAWSIGLPHSYLTEADAAGLNRALAAQALSEVYGAERAIVEDARLGQSHPSTPRVGPGPGLLVPSGQALREHEMDMFKFLTIIGGPPSEGREHWRVGWPLPEQPRPAEPDRTI